MNDTGITSDNKKMGVKALYPWWIILVLGIAALILGIAFLGWPYLTLVLVVTFIGAYWFITGIFSLISLIVDRSNPGWKILVGILGIFAGVVVLMFPLVSTLLVPMMFAVFIGVSGLMIGAVHLAQALGSKDWGSGLLGLMAVIFGILVLAHPFITAALIPFIFGGLGVVGGIIAIILSFQFRNMTSC